MSSILLPKCTGIAVFDQANEGAQEAAEELGTAEPEFLGPSTCEDPTGQIETMTNAATQGVDAVMISNNAGEQIQSGVDAATDADVSVVSWDSPIPSGEGESLFVAQVDFDETGVVMADMALEILGEDGGTFAILSASPDAANQNAWIEALETALEDEQYASLELVDTVYGNDDADESYDQALALVDSHPDLELIMAPDHRRHRRRGQGHDRRGPVRHGQGVRPGPARGDAGLHRERLRPAVRAVELRRPRLPHLLRHLRHRHGADRGRRGPDVHGRPDGRVHDRDGSDPRRRLADRDGPVHRLHRGQHRLVTARRRAGRVDDAPPGRRGQGPHPADEEDVRVHRFGFTLKVRPELVDEYRRHHAAVWPDMLDALRRAGWHNYSLFLQPDGTLFGYVETPGTLAEAQAAMAAEPVNERWQALMAPYFEGEGLPADQMMRELDVVFHLD